MSVSARTPGEAVAELAAKHWPRIWSGCDAAGTGADMLMRLREETTAWDLSDVQAMRGGRVGLVCLATARGRAVVVKLSPRVAGFEELEAEPDALVS